MSSAPAVPVLRALLVSFIVLTATVGCHSMKPRTAQAVNPVAACVPDGTWMDPVTRRALSMSEVTSRAAASRIVLLGEEHTRPEHHLWELETIAALYGRRPVVIALEMLQRSSQSAADRWVAGELDEQQFLTESGWKTFWQISPDLYLPILRFARLNRLPMRALNVPWELVYKLADTDWDAVPPEDRAGLTKPAPATPAYVKFLEETYGEHVKKVDVSSEAGTSRFIAAQLVWDRAFAEGLQAAVRDYPGAVVVGLIGMGHLKNGFGVPHQLADLGLSAKDVQVLLPWTAGDCDGFEPGVADAVFGMTVAETAPREHVPLGVRIEPLEEGVKIKDVFPGSVAAAAGLRVGDIIVSAAGMTLKAPGDLQEIIARQAGGTWLPLRVRRGHNEHEIVARFPAEPLGQ